MESESAFFFSKTLPDVLGVATYPLTERFWVAGRCGHRNIGPFL